MVASLKIIEKLNQKNYNKLQHYHINAKCHMAFFYNFEANGRPICNANL